MAYSKRHSHTLQWCKVEIENLFVNENFLARLKKNQSATEIPAKTIIRTYYQVFCLPDIVSEKKNVFIHAIAGLTLFKNLSVGFQNIKKEVVFQFFHIRAPRYTQSCKHKIWYRISSYSELDFGNIIFIRIPRQNTRTVLSVLLTKLVRYIFFNKARHFDIFFPAIGNKTRDELKIFYKKELNMFLQKYLHLLLACHRFFIPEIWWGSHTKMQPCNFMSGKL